jgi:anti-sigma B factor antagonist
MTDNTGAVLTLDLEQAGGKVVVRCHGRLVAGVCHQLYDCVHLMFPGTKCIVLDLTDLEYMDSLGLGTVVKLYVSAHSAGCSLRLVNLGRRVRELLGMTRLLNVLTDISEHGISFRL